MSVCLGFVRRPRVRYTDPSRQLSRHEEHRRDAQSKAEIIRALFAAYLSNDRKAVEDFFADDFRFTSPYDNRIDKATYFERCWRNSDWIERHELEKILVHGDEAFVTYDASPKAARVFATPSSFLFAGRQDQTYRRLFRRQLSGWRFRKQAELELESACR